MTYHLYYWPTIQGRGEFVRLALEEAGADYVDVAREEGDGSMLGIMEDAALPHPPFAPPFLRAGRMLIAQTANILLFLGDRHGLAPATEAGRLWTHQLQLTIADLVAEVHDAHHPIAASLYYEDQKAEAARRTAILLGERVPRYLGYFERIVAKAGGRGKWLAGARLTYADLSLYQVASGLEYAFPNAFARLRPAIPNVLDVAMRVRERPNLKLYLASPRRIGFSTQGIFRHYPELDP